MKGKAGGALFMILFSLPFLGVGIGAAYVLLQNVTDSMRAQEWVVAKARVESAELVSSRGSKGGTTYSAAGTYQYAIDGKNYTGKRLGLDRLGGSDNIGDWHQTMASYLKEAQASGKPISVYVNPDKPDEAVVDRELRWPWLLFVGVFAVMFGGGGVGIFVGGLYAARGPQPKKKARRGDSGEQDGTKSEGAAGIIGFWIFALVWNLVAFPVAIITVPELIESGEYWGLFVLLFPLFGSLMLWGAIQSTLALVWRGSATLSLDPKLPTVGADFNGVVRFSRSVPAGERYNVELVCLKRGSSSGTNQIDAWSKTIEARSQRGADGVTKLVFRFRPPGNQPPTTEDDKAAEQYTWRLEVERQEPKKAAPFGFAVFIGPAPHGARDTFAEPDALHPASPALATGAATFKPEMEAELVKLFGAENVAKMPQTQREAITRLTPAQRATAAKIKLWFPRIIKIVVALVVLQFAIGAVTAIVAGFNS